MHLHLALLPRDSVSCDHSSLLVVQVGARHRGGHLRRPGYRDGARQRSRCPGLQREDSRQDTDGALLHAPCATVCESYSLPHLVSSLSSSDAWLS